MSGWLRGVSGWWTVSRQTAWIYCPQCRREMIAAGDFAGYRDCGLLLYRCGGCGLESEWDFGAPVPLLYRKEPTP